MARPIVLSNGELHIGLNNYGLVHDVYYPYVGLENHASGSSIRHRVGVWADGSLSWLDDGQWSFQFHYSEQALIGHTLARNDQLGLLLEIDDFVDSSMNGFMRNIHVINLRDERREVRVFMHQAFIIGDSRSTTDTAQYLPDSEAIVHYRGRRAFVVGGRHGDQSFDQHSIGLFGTEGHEGTYRDADDGELDGGNVEHGRVDSTIRFQLIIDPHESERLHYWITFGTSMREALYIDKQIRQVGVIARMHDTASYWHKWLAPARSMSEKLTDSYRESFMHSMMIIKAHIDRRGAVMASTDSSLLHYSRDDYAYCWPRDGALILWPLIRMGYVDEPRRFFEFCRRGLHPGGYLLHKYRADGGLGASWHSYVHDNATAPPIQEDETALVLFVFAQFYEATQDRQLLRDFYEDMVRPMASFLAEHVDTSTGLPKPSYDLWEEVYITSTYTTAVVHAALLAAADLAEAIKDGNSAVRWRTVADDIRVAAQKHLFNDKRSSFVKGITIKDGELYKDETIDASSVYGVFMFGLFSLQSDELQKAIQTLTTTLKASPTQIGCPRYENDTYRRIDPESQGNWWPIVALWQAQISLEQGDEEAAYRVIDWVRKISTTTGMIPEQVNPADESVISPTPLTWSQAEYVSTLLDTIIKHER